MHVYVILFVKGKSIYLKLKDNLGISLRAIPYPLDYVVVSQRQENLTFIFLLLIVTNIATRGNCYAF